MKEQEKTEAYSIYLPYKVRVIREDLNIERYLSMESMAYCGTAYFSSDKFNPILRPLSDLTDDEWKSVFEALLPCVKAVFTEHTFSILKDEDEVGYNISWVEYSKFFDKTYRCGSYVSFNTTSKLFCIPESQEPNHFAAFQKLASLHADFQGLIEKGWAVDKTKLS